MIICLKKISIDMKVRTYGLFASILGLVACESGEFGMEAPTVYFSSDGKYEISLIDTLELEPKIVYDYNTTYKWTQDGEFVSSDLCYTFIPVKLKDYKLSFSVENDKGKSSHDILISVVKNVDFSAFSNYKVPVKTTIAMKADTLEENGFVTEGIRFSNYVLAVDTLDKPTMWSGFAFSNKSNVTTTLSMSAIGCAYSSSSRSTYMAVSCYEHLPLVAFDSYYTIKSLDVAWDNFSYLVSRFGAEYENGSIVKAATKGDVIDLVIYGLNEQGEIVGKQSCNLLNCDSEDASKYYRLTSWVSLDLSSLGSVSGLTFGISSTIDNFPPFFCIDELKLQE